MAVSYNGLVTISLASGPGTIFSGTTTVACSAGVADLSDIVIRTAGTYTLRAASGAVASVVSSGFNVIAATATSLVFSTQPQTAESDEPIPAFATTACDAYGNVATDFTDNVTVTINSGTGTLSGTTTVPSVAGVADFTDVWIDLPPLSPGDTFTLGAMGGSLPVVVSTSFVVLPEAQHTMEFEVQPGDTTAGVAIPSFQVWFYDADHTICTDDNYDVTISIASGAATIYSGTLTENFLHTGKATFDNIVIRTAGTYTFRATCPAALTELSGSFVVSPAAAASLAFTTQPVGSIEGTIMPTVVVTAHDAFGNVAAGFGSPVTMSKWSGPGTLSGTLTVPAVNGVATFSDLSLSEDGSYTLTASHDALNVVSNSFDVTPVATQVTFRTQPGNTTAGSPIPDFTVGVYDEDGDLVTGYVGTITVAKATGAGGIVSGNTTVAVVNGLATFTGLVIDVADAYTLRATCDSLTAAVSNSFTVAASAATGIDIFDAARKYRGRLAHRRLRRNRPRCLRQYGVRVCGHVERIDRDRTRRLCRRQHHGKRCRRRRDVFRSSHPEGRRLHLAGERRRHDDHRLELVHDQPRSCKLCRVLDATDRHDCRNVDSDLRRDCLRRLRQRRRRLQRRSSHQRGQRLGNDHLGYANSDPSAAAWRRSTISSSRRPTATLCGQRAAN